VSFYILNCHLNLKGTGFRHYWLCRIYFSLPKIINPVHIQHLAEIVPPPSQNTVGVCNQVTLLIFYYINSRLAPPLKVINTPTQVCDILVLTVCFKFITFSFQIFLLFFLKYLLSSRVTVCRYLHYFGLDSVTTSFYLKILHILHQTMVYLAFISAILLGWNFNIYRHFTFKSDIKIE
jgi:hypothetical protein